MRRPPDVHGGVLVKRKPLEQVHLCLGLKGVAAGHQDRYAVYALNSVLGGSVSSRLFQEVREKRGFAYSIYSFLSGYSDGGTITVYAATEAERSGSRRRSCLPRDHADQQAKASNGKNLSEQRIK